MNAADVIGFTYDGAAYCTDCEPDGLEDDACGVIFAECHDETVGTTCDGCRACYGPDGWSEPNCDASQWRWATCDQCNGQRPYDRGDTDSRLSALQDDLACVSCIRGRVHF